MLTVSAEADFQGMGWHAMRKYKKINLQKLRYLQKIISTKSI